jgi:hemerythrin-like domain-containing protein
MLAQLQQRSMPQDDVVELLREAHEGLRRFLRLGRRLVMSPSSEAEVYSLAGMIRSYSAVGLQLVIADEEALVPYLAGRSANLDRAIARMRTYHVEYSGHVRRLMALCRVIEREPRDLGGRGRELAEVINAMALYVEPHLAVMEREIFPALGSLAQDQRDQLRSAMVARRDRALRADW